MADQETRFIEALDLIEEEQYDKALPILQDLANEGDVGAQCWLANCFHYGMGTDQNPAKAAEWYRKAAEQGDEVAQCSFGMALYIGQGVEQNETLALEWFHKSAEQGNAQAQYAIGGCFYYGDAVTKQDFVKAVEWFRKAAENGDAGAQYKLACCYQDGTGVERDASKAFELLTTAAKMGDKNAIEILDNLAAERFGNGSPTEQARYKQYLDEKR